MTIVESKTNISSLADNALKDGPVLLNIGAGATGTNLLLSQTEAIEEKWESQGRPDDFPVYTIIVADKSGTFGPGGPYGENESERALCNQEGCEQTKNRGYTTWLADNGHASNEREAQDSFYRRRLFGNFLEETFHKTCIKIRESQLPIRIITVAEDISEIDHQPTNIFSLKTQSDGTIKADVVTAATGHQFNNSLNGFRVYGSYFEPPFIAAPIQQSLGNRFYDPDTALFVRGTAQSFVDAVDELASAGYKGKFYAASRKKITPWERKPETHHNPFPGTDIYAYKPEFFCREVLESQDQWTYSDLEQLFLKEIKAVEKNPKWDVGHVLEACGSDYFRALITRRLNPEDKNRFNDLFNAVYANPTAPRRFRLLQDFVDQGRLIYLKTPAEEENFEYNPQLGRYAVSGLQDSNAPSHVDGILNASKYARSVFGQDGTPYCETLKTPQQQGWLREHHKDSGVLEPGEQNIEGFFVAGPPLCSPGIWGNASSWLDTVTTGRKTVERASDFWNKRSATLSAAIA